MQLTLRPRALTLSFSLCAVLGSTSAASAQPADGPGGPKAAAEEPASRGEVQVDLGLSVPPDGTSVTFAFLSPQLRARYMVIDDLELGLDWGIAILHASGDGDSQTEARLGNPTLSARLHLDLEGLGKLQIGGGIALPVIRSSDNLFETAVVSGAAASLDGLHDIWRWRIDNVTVFAPLELSRDLTENLRLTADTTLAFFFPVGDLQKFQMGIQAGGGLAYVVDDSWVGVRLQVVSLFVNTLEGQDNTQVSLAPEGRLDMGKWYLHGQFVLNLDKPLGFAFDTGGVWGLFMGAGFKI